MNEYDDRWDAIYDIETLNTDQSKTPIIDMSAYKFNWGRFTTDPYTFEELLGDIKRYKVSVKDQVKNYGAEVCPETLQFWEEQAAVVRKRITPKKDDLLVEDFLEQLFSHMTSSHQPTFHWSRNNTFDPVVVAMLARKAGMFERYRQAFKFWAVRDVKTWIDAKFDFSIDQNFIPVADEEYWNNTFEHHNSVHDVAADVLRLQAIRRGEEDLETVDR